jgi:uncharacterized protein YjbI with pentapeptide repeats
MTSARSEPLTKLSQDQLNTHVDKHIAWLQTKKEAGAQLKLEGYDFHGLLFGGANLSEAILSGSDFSRMDLADVVFSKADLSRCVFRECKLQNASLSGAKLESSDFTGADLRSANLHGVQAEAARFDAIKGSGANFESANLVRSSFQGATLVGARFPKASLSVVLFRRANLEEANFVEAKGGAFFESANLDKTDLCNAKFGLANFEGATLRRSNLERADFTVADIGGANFYEANVPLAQFAGVRGAHKALHLETTKPAAAEPHGALYFEDCLREPWEVYIDWERLRTFGKLPLFGVSYTALILIPAFLFLLAFWNDKVAVVHRWADRAVEAAGKDPAVIAAANTVKERLREQPIPSQSLIFLVSVVLLAIASTIYAVFCPSRVKEFSKDQWSDQLGRTLLHYWPLSWKYRPLRLICGACYVVGGLGALWVIGSKVVRAGIYIVQHSTFSFL